MYIQGIGKHENKKSYIKYVLCM